MSKKCTPLWREAHFEVKMYKTHRSRTTFGSSDVEKVHAVVARSIFPSQKCKKLTCTEHFWTFRCAFAWQAQGIVQILRFAKMILRDRCSTSYGLWHDFFVAGAVLSTGGLENRNILARGCQLCTQLSILEGSLAELLRFGGCQGEKLKTSCRLALFRMLSSSKNKTTRRIVSFWTLLCSNIKEVSQKF